MLTLVRTWLEMCWLRATPRQVPASPYLLWLALGFYLLVDLLTALPGAGWRSALGLTLVDLALLVGFTALLLRLSGKQARLNQTLSALAGTGALLGLVALPLVLAVQQDPAPPLAGLLWLVVLFWSLAVRAHILRHALSVPFGVGLVISAVYAVILLWLVQWLFPISR